MEQLLSSLKTVPEYASLLQAVKAQQSAAVTGIGQINRSHMIAALRTMELPIVRTHRKRPRVNFFIRSMNHALESSPSKKPAREPMTMRGTYVKMVLYDVAVASR